MQTVSFLPSLSCLHKLEEELRDIAKRLDCEGSWANSCAEEAEAGVEAGEGILTLENNSSDDDRVCLLDDGVATPFFL